MNTVYFNDYNSWKDFSLVLSSHSIEAPTPKSEKVDVFGADGELDYTEYFGEVKYKNRKISLNFTTFGKSNVLKERLSEFLNLVHGQTMNIVMSDDSDFYYVGRVEVKTPSVKKGIMTIPIECDCEPYKYAVQETVLKRDVWGEDAVTLDCTNLRMTVIPTIKVLWGEITVTYGTFATTLQMGTWVVPQIIFTKGSNLLTVDGMGEFEIHYREGGL